MVRLRLACEARSVDLNSCLACSCLQSHSDYLGIVRLDLLLSLEWMIERRLLSAESSDFVSCCCQLHGSHSSSRLTERELSSLESLQWLDLASVDLQSKVINLAATLELVLHHPA